MVKTKIFFMKNILAYIAVMCAMHVAVAPAVFAADQTTLSVTVNSITVPPTATIVRVDNVTAHTADVVVDADPSYANINVDVVLTFTDHNGQTTQQTVRVTVDATGRMTVPATNLLPGTQYGVTVQYSVAGANIYSTPSASATFTTLIDAPHTLTAAVNPVTPSTAVDLTVGIDGALVGTAAVFTVEVTHQKTNAVYTIQSTKTVDGSTVTLPVTGLDPATTYSFRVKYGRMGTTVESDYSAPATATTLPLTPNIGTIVPDPNNTDTGVTVPMIVDAGVVGSTIDVVLMVKNTDTGVVTTLHLTVPVTDTTVNIPVAGLAPGTTYAFQAQYAPTGTAAFSYPSAEVIATTSAPSAPIITSIVADPIAPDTRAMVTLAVDSDLIGHTMDFAVALTDTRTGQTVIVHVTTPITDTTVTLPVAGLVPSTAYDVDVRYALVGTSAYSPSSNTVSHTTATPSAPIIVSVDPDAVHPTTAATVVVSVDPAVIGTTITMVVQVTNPQTGQILTFPVTVLVTSSTISVPITGLSPDTHYTIAAQYGIGGAGTLSPLSPSVPYNTSRTKDDDKKNDKKDDNKKSDDAGTTETVVLPPAGPWIPTDTLPATPEDAGVTPPTPHIPAPDTGDTGDATASPTTPAKDSRDGRRDWTIAAAVGTVAEWATFGTRIARDYLATSAGEAGYRALATAGATAGVASALAVGAVPFFSALPNAMVGGTFLRFLELFGVLGRRKEERNWGTVFEKMTHLPIPAVKIVLTDMKGDELATTYSDREGRFGFLVEPGTYYFQAHKKDFVVVNNIERDDLYGSVYHGTPVTIAKDTVMVTNIAMESLTQDWEAYGRRKVAQYHSLFSIVKKYFFVVLYYAGFLATAVITYFFPSLFNIVMLTLYVMIFIYQTFFKKKKYGEVVTAAGAPIPFAVVSLHDTGTGTKEKFAVTDGAGRYYMLADDGKYTIRAKGQPVSGVAFDKQAQVVVRDGIVKEDVVV